MAEYTQVYSSVIRSRRAWTSPKPFFFIFSFFSGVLLCYSFATRLDLVLIGLALDVPAMVVQGCLTALVTAAVAKQAKD